MAPDTHIVVVDAGHLADHLLMVPLASLRASDQSRQLNTEVVAGLAHSLKEVGLIQPITVMPCVIMNGIAEDGYRIVAGHHRVAAAGALGWTEIPAIVLDADINYLAAELIEIDENLVRSELTAAQRAGAIKRRKQIWEAMHPQQTGGTTCSSSLSDGRRAGPQHGQGFAAETAAVTGQSKQDINRHVARAEALGDDLNAVVRTSLDKGVELDALKRLPADQRKALIKRAAAGEKISAKTPRAKGEATDPAAPPSQQYSDGLRASMAAFEKVVVALRDAAEHSEDIYKLNGAWAHDINEKVMDALKTLPPAMETTAAAFLAWSNKVTIDWAWRNAK